MTKPCPRCRLSVLWHRVYRTKAGIRAYCRPKPILGRRPEAVGALEGEAVDVWGRLHIVTEGEQLTFMEMV